MIKDMDNCLFSYIANFKVLDKNNVNIGHIGDALLNKSDFDMESVIIYGSFLEEKLEDLRVKEDIDPIVPINLIANVDRDNSTVTLSELKENLNTTKKGWNPPNDVYQFSKIKKTSVVDSENVKIGNIIDVYWGSEKNYVLVIGGGWLEEFLESIRVFADKDLLVPNTLISSFTSDEIKLKVNKNLLRTTLEGSLKPKDIVSSQQAGFVHRGSMNNLMVDRLLLR